MNSTFRKAFVLVAMLALVAAACGDSEAASDSTVGTSTTTPPSTAAATTAPPATAAPTTAAPTTAAPTTAAPTTAPPTTAPLVRGEIRESFVGSPATPYSAELIVDGNVSVYFNNGSNGTLIAIYHGPGVADPTDLCPGNSLNDGGFMYISNAPATPGACDGFTTDRGSVRVCTGGVWLYETMIPNDSVGTLWGSLDKNSDAGIIGMTGQSVNQADTPEIDYAADVFDISAMFTSDGSTEITCGSAMS